MVKDENILLLLRGKFDKVLVPYPSDLVGGVVLVFRKPKLAFFSNDIEYLEKKKYQHQKMKRDVGTLTSPET